MKKIQLITLFVLVAVAFSNCKKDPVAGTNGAQGPAGPSLTGNLKGYVSLYDQFGGKILTNLAGDTVSIVGTSKIAVTDSTGLYTFTGLTTGNYTLTFNKAGYGMEKLNNIQFVGGGDTYQSVKLSQPSTFNITGLLDSIGPITGNVTVYGTIPTNVQGRTFIVYVGNNALVASGSNSYLINYTKTTNPNAIKVAFVIPKSDLYDAGFGTGSTAYIAAYGIASTLTASAYIDDSNGRTVYNTVSSVPATLNFIVP